MEALHKLLLFLIVLAAKAQDPYEIHVYEYEPLKPGQFTLEQHLNYWAKAENRQFHMTHELTGGIAPWFSLGAMQLSTVRPIGNGLDAAGWRVLPHFYAPESWGLPVKLGLVTEFSFMRQRYDEDTRSVEIRPIVERRFGEFQIDFNPVFSRVLHGPGIRDGWHFEPAARIAYGDAESRRFVPSLEWYSAPQAKPTPFHQLLPGVDIRLRERLIWSTGLGVGITSAEPRLVCKSRLEFTFGRR